MSVVFQRPVSLEEKKFHYCPGCHHGVVHRLVAEVIDELGIQEKTVVVGPVGCSLFIYEYIDVDGVSAAHGRAPAVATGVKRALPDKVVFTYQGDGDLAAIGTAEIVHAAARGENITVIFVNNSIYGMTGGQMAPTSLLGQKTTTSPAGRDPQRAGFPINVCEMLSALDGATYLERVSVHSVKHVFQAKKAIKQAFQNQINGKGFSLVEVLAACPTNWKMDSEKCIEWMEAEMVQQFPLGNFSRAKEVKNA
jgi:2-oxoglutarate ferredoxin oxidoreductase subunit beta